MAIKGFFQIETVKPKKNKLQDLRYNTPGEPDCANCGLDKLYPKECKSPPIGKGKKGILLILEYPGKKEVELFLQNTLKPMGIDLLQDCLITNSVNCSMPEGRDPKNQELLCCKPRVLKVIQDFKPKHIWVFGSNAIESYLGNRFKRKSINRWVDIPFPDPTNGAWVTAQFHPSFVIHNKKSENLKAINEKYLRKAITRSHWDPFVFPNFEEQVTVLTDLKRILFHLKRILRNKPPIVIDYETTGVKPYKMGHKVYCVSIDDGERSYVFPLQRPGHWKEEEYQEIIQLYAAIMTDPLILKTAHGRNFEDSWSQVVLKTPVQGWDWCTMHTAHLIDSRPYHTGLKFQAFIHFGVEGYEDEVHPFLEAAEKGEEFNNIQNAPVDKLHLYCGMDTVCTRELKKKQQQILKANPDLEKARLFTMEGLEALMDLQNRGIPIDKDYYEDQNNRLTKRKRRLEVLINQSEEAETYKKRTGKTFNPNSSKDLQHLFFNILGFTPTKFTNEKEDNASVDAEVLTGIKSPLAEMIMSYKKLDKIQGTYLAQFFRELTEESKIHPVQNLHIANTHRSSQDHPNFQNIPVRDEEAQRICRAGIVARRKSKLPNDPIFQMPQDPMFRLCEKDYGSQEVRIIACYSEDEKLVSYILDPTTDMHRDEAAHLFILPKERVSKKIRFFGKNCWTFPQFYQSYYVSCGKELWKNVVEPNIKTEDGEFIQDHLKSKGIYTLERYIDHCKKMEAIFWDKYKGVKRWQKKVLDEYRRNGYVSTFFGHRVTGFLSPNQVVNCPIQGTAFHCLLWSLKEARIVFRERNFLSGFINQIHDSMKSQILPSEQNEYLEIIHEIAEVRIRKEHKWLIVPLTLEIEMTPIGGNWSEKELVVLVNGKWCSFNKDKTIKHVYDENY